MSSKLCSHFSLPVLLSILVAFASGASAQENERNDDRPNVVVIMFDQLRYDAFSHRNNEVIQTPHIDRLAAEGIVFNQATCTSPVCGPSRAAMLSGCYAYDGKYITRNRELDQPTPFVFPIKTVDELLDENGYHVEYRGKWHCGNKHLDVYKSREHIFGHKLDSYTKYLEGKGYKRNIGKEYLRDSYTKWTYKAWDVDHMIGKGPRDPDYWIGHSSQAGIIEVADEDTLTAWTAQKTIDFLDSAPKRPFSITCSILHPHGPVIPNQTYANMFKPEDMPLPENMYSSRVPRFGKKAPIPDKITHEGVQQFTALYYALVKECDDMVGKVLEALERNGLTENTLVIFTADHGEFLGSHNDFGKGEFYEEAFRVPLIMRYPKEIKPGTKSDSIATGADMAPTILDYCNVPKPEWMHGRSLREVINGGNDPVEYAYGQIRNEQCLRSTEWKFAVNNGQPFLFFDLVNDPLEMENLLDNPSKMSGKAKAKMEEMRSILQTKYKMVPARRGIVLNQSSE